MSSTLAVLCRAGLVAGVSALAVAGSQAAPVLWTLTDAKFTDGATATGSFVFDADTSSFSGVSITKTGGAYASVTYTTRTQFTAPASNYFEFGTSAVLDTGDFFIDLISVAALTNAGGVVGLIPAVNPLAFLQDSMFGRCGDAGCNFGVDLVGLNAGASLVGPQLDGAVPEPATLLLVLGAGVGALAVRRRQPRIAGIVAR